MMLEARLRQFFSCCFADDQTDAHQISYACDPKLEEGRGGPLRMPPSAGHLQKIPTSEIDGHAKGNSSARSHGSAPSTARSLTPEERQKEKERLQDMVKEFAKAVVQGQPCQWMDVSGIGGPKNATYCIDKSISTFSVRPENETPISFPMANILEVIKERENTPFSSLRIFLPSREEEPRLERRFVCVQHEEVKGEIKHLGMLLPNPQERERFYTCMKILRWALDSRRDHSQS